MALTQIKQAWLNLTADCNNNCKWCYAESFIGTNNNFPCDKLLATYDFLVKVGCGRVLFLGGEPTLYTKLPRAIKLASQKGLRQCIVTNGRILSQKGFLEKLGGNTEELDFIVSLEGGTSITHDTVTRTEGSFYESLQGIKNCVNFGYNVTPNITIGTSNTHDLYSFFDIVSSLGLEAISINFALPPVNCIFQQEDYITSTNMTQILEKIAHFCQLSQMRIFIATPVEYCLIPEKLWSFIESSQVVLTTCHMLSGIGIVVDWNLNILPCTHLPNITIGNLNCFNSIESFTDYWNREMEKAFRSNLRRLPYKRCSKCNHRDRCTGGCPLMSTFHSEKELLSHASN